MALHESFAYRMLKKTYESPCDKKGAFHYCFVCGKPFRITDATYCPKCNWWKSPCGHCACDLNLEERVNLELAFKDICGGTCRLNPKKRKKHGSNIIRGITKEEFLEWANKHYPALVEKYNKGEIDFDKLHFEISTRTGLVWIF